MNPLVKAIQELAVFLGKKLDRLIDQPQKIQLDIGDISKQVDSFTQQSARLLSIIPEALQSNNKEVRASVLDFSKSLDELARNIQQSVESTKPLNAALLSQLKTESLTRTQDTQEQIKAFKVLPEAITSQTSTLTRGLADATVQIVNASKEITEALDTQDIDLSPVIKQLQKLNDTLSKKEPVTDKEVIKQLKEINKALAGSATNKTPQYIIGGGGGGTALSSTVDNGAKTVGVSAVQITSSSYKTKNGVVVKAAASNTGIIYVADSSTVTANSSDATDGFPLSASQSITIPVDKPSRIYAIASLADQKVFWLGQ